MADSGCAMYRLCQMAVAGAIGASIGNATSVISMIYEVVAMVIRTVLLLCGFIAGTCAVAHAETAAFCVSCTGPEQTYLCAIESGGAGRNAASLRLYCVVNTARERGHQSCTARKEGADSCDGPRLNYVYSDENLPLFKAPDAATGPSDGNAETAGGGASLPSGRKSGEAETMVDLTGKAITSSKKRLRKAGDTVGEVTSKTGEAVRGAARTTGSRVRRAVKKAGKAVGKAARTTYDCVRTLFGNCW